MIYKFSHSGEVTWPSPRYPESFWLLWRIQSSYQHFVFRFRISLKNGFRRKLNHPKQSKSPNPLLIPITYLSHYQFTNIMSYSENFKFLSLDSESHQNLGLNASWTVWIREDHPTCSWCPHYYLWYNRPYLGISHIWACPITAVTLAKMFVNLGPDIFLQAIGQHANCIESRSPDPLNKSHLGISHIWACPITAVTLAKMLVNLGPDMFYQLLANMLFALRAGHLTPLKSPI